MHKLLEFDDPKLLRRALTHRSYVNEHPGEGEHNERLEFLGDAILNFLSGEYLYEKHGEKGEDELTRRRSALVDEKQLAKFAIEVGLNSRMLLGQGAKLDGGYQNPNLLSSTFEAVIGAYYLDKKSDITGTIGITGITKVSEIVKGFFDSVPENIVVSRSNVDSKNRFQELVQSKGITTPPIYETKQIGGPSHAPIFVATVFVNGIEHGTGRGRNKKEAEKDAAENALANTISR
ncbi:ribonuclease III [Nostoc sp. 'Peltigera malacea cyanobiont' DB3992]|uniref:ribonuclease III n=1 Tax=Nostoc sp. 'Peltigera malacea cyanobiont' DB3992 TaxID=1206980 RepID=UPI000C04FC52|nr:ribonuclease III [Nostoc sp. 'Peltigera malacea cyanobiont' DB3992]PHM09233.1 ribonuclease III [Nostoc sp. 'Peltigera malacea cyanobiont' DB3992]